MINENLAPGKKLYFVSDAHLGLPPREKSLAREKKLVQWLDTIKSDAHAIYLMGDIFDYWFEYKKVVPRGFVRFLGKIAEITDSGIPVYYFTGNHDVWIFDYLPAEIGIRVFYAPQTHTYNGKKFYLAHGDGLGEGEFLYKILKRIFVSKTMQWLYARIHPNTATGFAHRWSKKSRLSKDEYTGFLGEEKEHLIQHAQKILSDETFHYFIFGHRHLPLNFELQKDCRLVCLGDWFVNYTYAVFNGASIELLKADATN
jgi:UDP-2,3-diacylglucosamine hydrolase